MTDPDASIHEQITALVAREHALRDDVGGADHAQQDADRRELAEIEKALDVCWDLLRQRQARREFGQDESGAEARSESTVENYRQ